MLSNKNLCAVAPVISMVCLVRGALNVTILPLHNRAPSKLSYRSPHWHIPSQVITRVASVEVIATADIG